MNVLKVGSKLKKIAKLDNDTNLLLRISNNIAIVYSTSGREKEALKIFKDQKRYTKQKKTPVVL